MDPLDYLRILRRRWWVWLTVLAITFGAALLSLPRGGTFSEGPLAGSFTATNTLLQGPDVSAKVDLQLTKLFATTGEIPRIAAESLGRPPEDGPLIAAGVSVVVDPKVGSMSISVVGGDGDQAARTANAFAEAVRTFLRSRAQKDREDEVTALQARLTNLEASIIDLQRRLVGSPLETPILQAQQLALTNQYQVGFERLQSLQAQAAAGSPLETLQTAVPIPVDATGNPVPASPPGRLGLAIVVGLLLGMALAVVVDRLDTRMRTREQIETATRLPIVSEIPRLPRRQRGSLEVVTATTPRSGAAEAYRALRAAVLLVPSRVIARGDTETRPIDLSAWRSPRVLLVTSPVASEGKTSTVVNLAAALAESGRSVMVLDADFRKPAAHRFLGVPRSAGLSDLLDVGLPGGVADALRPTSLRGVSLITSGTSSRTPAAMLSKLGDVLAQTRDKADVVLIDAAPLLVANDATDIVPHVDSVILVTQAGRTSAAQAERAVDLLSLLVVPVLGVVVQASDEADGIGSHEGYGRAARSASSSADSDGSAEAEPSPAPDPHEDRPVSWATTTPSESPGVSSPAGWGALAAEPAALPQQDAARVTPEPHEESA